MTRYFPKPISQDGWGVSHVVITEEMVKREHLNAMMHPGAYFLVDDLVPGRYVRLHHGGTAPEHIVMSTTPMEQKTNREIVRTAHGDVLIAGLGLGMIVLPIMRKPEVRSVTVLEKERAVIDLVAPRLPLNEKVKIVEADAFEWRPPRIVSGEPHFTDLRIRVRPMLYDTIYFDIWAQISAKNADQVGRLHRRYKNWKRPGGIMQSWMQDYVRWQRDSGR